MTNLKTLAAAGFVAIASMTAPAFAADGSVTRNTVDAVQFYAVGPQGQGATRLIEGRNSVIEPRIDNKAAAAVAQGFAPVDQQSLMNGLNR
jgi:hypothetical protein